MNLLPLLPISPKTSKTPQNLSSPCTPDSCSSVHVAVPLHLRCPPSIGAHYSVVGQTKTFFLERSQRACCFSRHLHGRTVDNPIVNRGMLLTERGGGVSLWRMGFVS